MQPCFQQVFHLFGAQSADHEWRFKAPFGMTLVHVSMSNSTANAGTLDLGTSADPDGWKDGVAMGVSSACTELNKPSDFNGALMDGKSYPRLAAGEIGCIKIIDHGSHMANAVVVLTWMPG